MTQVDQLWREVRRAPSFPATISRFKTWLEGMWPQARSLGITRLSTRRRPVPAVMVDDHFHLWKKADFGDDTIVVLGPELLDKQLSVYMEWASPTLSAPRPARLDYLRACLLHETVHALDAAEGNENGLHDRSFWYRLTKLENRFDPRGLT